MVKLQTVLTLSEGCHPQFEDFFGKKYVSVSWLVLQGSYKLLLSSCPQNKAKVSAETLPIFANALDTLTVTCLGVRHSHEHFLLNLSFSAEQKFILYIKMFIIKWKNL